MTWPQGSSEMARHVRTFDWAATPLGSVDGWPQILRQTVDLLLAHPMPMSLLWGADLIHIYNDDSARMFGVKHPAAFGHPIYEQWRESQHLMRPIFDRVWAGEAVRLEDVFYPNAHSGAMADNWYMTAHSPMRDQDGRVTGILITVLEMTAQKKAERRLRETEERQRFLLRFNDALRPLADPVQIQRMAMQLVHERFNPLRSIYFEVGADGDGVVAMECIPGEISRPAALRITDFGVGIAEELACGRPVIVEDSEQDPRMDERGRTAFRMAHCRGALCVPLCKDGKLVAAAGVNFPGPRTWNESELCLLAEVMERTWDAAERARAETALRQSEERLRLMVAELQHRVRNILTIVRSVFSRTVEVGGEWADNADHFKGRLDALARTQIIVTQTLDGTADLENLIRDELISAGVHDGPNVQIGGPDVTLSSRIAETLGLAIHELTTNALKYGALRVEGAQLVIFWTVHPRADGLPHLNLCWEEHGVPAIALNPAREGFGRELIEEALPYRLGAETTLDFQGGGVRCSISLPLASP